MESISSIKTTAGRCCSAAWNSLERFFSDSPTNFEIMSSAATEKKFNPAVLANALAIVVFPVPGGP
jgi:hypothetical protein